MHKLSRKHIEYGNVRDLLFRVSKNTEIDGEFIWIVIFNENMMNREGDKHLANDGALELTRANQKANGGHHRFSDSL